MQSESPVMSDESERQEVILFKYKRTLHEDSYNQIKVSTKKIKPHQEFVEQAEKNYRKQHYKDRQTLLAELFNKLELNLNPSNKLQSKPQIYKQMSIQSNKNKYFLEKVQVGKFMQNQNASFFDDKQVSIQEKSKQFTEKARKKNIQKKFGQFREKNSNKARRTKYKIIDIKQQNIVYLNGQKFQYQDLSKECGSKANYMQDYYVLKKGSISNQCHHPLIQLPIQAEYLLQDEQNQKEEQYRQNQSDDSNREDRSDYDYPEEDYCDDDSDKSEGVIPAKNKRYCRSDSDLANSYGEEGKEGEDEQECYRRYLERCKKMSEGDDELTYLYSLKATKYQSDSDE